MLLSAPLYINCKTYIHQCNCKTNINKDAAIQLIHHAGTDLRRLDSELDKLATYIYPHKTIEVRHIKELCSSTEDIFRMTDYWITNQKASALIELNKLFEKNHPIRIVSTMQSLLKRWLRIKLELKNRSIKEVAEIVGLHPYVVEQDAKKLKNVSIEQLVKLRKNLSEAEYNIKSGKIEPEISLEMAITQ